MTGARTESSDMATTTLDEVDSHLRAIISNLYTLIVQAHAYQGQDTQQAMKTEIKNLLQNLQSLSLSSRRLPTRLPVEIIQYVENSRNPDIYTREFVELVMRFNQQQKGRSEAYAQFRDILGREMLNDMPDAREDVQKVLLAAGNVGQ